MNCWGASVAGVAGTVLFTFGLLACGGDSTPSRSEPPAWTPAIFVDELPAPPSGDATLASVRLRKPDFSTWEQMLEYIEYRHARIRSLAENSPDEMVSAHVTTKGLLKDDLIRLSEEYPINPDYVTFIHTDTTGGGLGPVVGSLKEYLRDNWLITQFTGRATAEEWVRFMDEEPSAVVVDANPFLDKRERLKPEYIIMRTPYGIYDDFLRLSPEANDGEIELDGESTRLATSDKLGSDEVELWDDANAFALAYVAGDFGRIWDEFRPSSCRSTLTRQAYVEDRQASFHVYVYPPGTMEFLPPTDIEIDGERATFDFRTIEQARGYPDRLETLRVEAVREDGRWHFGIFVLRSDSGAWFYVPVDTETCGRPKGEQ